MRMFHSLVDFASEFPDVYETLKLPYILILINKGICFGAQKNLKLGNVSLSRSK